VEPERLLRLLMGHVPASAPAAQPHRPDEAGVSDESGRYAS
jgi:hypothetical protein